MSGISNITGLVATEKVCYLDRNQIQYLRTVSCRSFQTQNENTYLVRMLAYSPPFVLTQQVLSAVYPKRVELPDQPMKNTPPATSHHINWLNFPRIVTRRQVKVMISSVTQELSPLVKP
jgi:hypothetical protein